MEPMRRVPVLSKFAQNLLRAMSTDFPDAVPRSMSGHAIKVQGYFANRS